MRKIPWLQQDTGFLMGAAYRPLINMANHSTMVLHIALLYIIQAQTIPHALYGLTPIIWTRAHAL